MFTREKSKKCLSMFIAVLFLSVFFTFMMHTEQAEAKQAKKGKEVVVNVIFGDTPDWTLLEDNIDMF